MTYTANTEYTAKLYFREGLWSAHVRLGEAFVGETNSHSTKKAALQVAKLIAEEIAEESVKEKEVGAEPNIGLGVYD